MFTPNISDLITLGPFYLFMCGNLLVGVPQYILHVRDNRQNVLKNGTINGRRTNEVNGNSHNVQLLPSPSQ